MQNMTKCESKDDLVQPDGTLAPNDAAFQTSYKGEIANNVFMFSIAMWMVRPNTCFLFTVPVFGDLSGDTSH